MLLTSSLLMDSTRHWLLANPDYFHSRHFLCLLEEIAQLVLADLDEQYQLMADLVEGYWGQYSLGVPVASLMNPTGAILICDELAFLSAAIKVCSRHVVVDETYHSLTYGCDVSSVLKFDGSTFVLNSLPKYFGITSCKLGWLVAPSVALADPEKLVKDHHISASSIAQCAALTCFEPQKLAVLEEHCAGFGRCLEFLLLTLRELGFGIAAAPGDAFFLYADISAFGGDAFAFCLYFLETEHIAIVIGFGCFQSGYYVHFAYTQSLWVLQKAVERIARGLPSRKV